MSSPVSMTPTVYTWTRPLDVEHSGTPSSANVSSRCTSLDMSLENVGYSMIMSFVLFFSVSGNLMVVLAVCMSNSLKRRRTYYFLVSLVFTVPFKISVKVHSSNFCLGISACYFQMLTDVFTNVASILNLLLISVDRFVAVQIPYQYLSLLSSRIAKRLIAGTWCFAGVWSLIGVYNWSHKPHSSSNQILVSEKTHLHTYSVKVGRMCTNKNTSYFIVSFYGIYVPVLIIMTGIYGSIMRTTLAHIRHIKSHTCVKGKINPIVKNAMAMVPMSPTLVDDTIVRQNEDFTSFRKERQATKSVAIIYIAFCVCWLPTCVITTIIHVDKKYFVGLQQKNMHLFLTIYYLFIEVFPLVNTMLNPIIYSFSNSQFRSAVTRVGRKFLGKPQQRPSEYELVAFNRRITRTSLSVTRNQCETSYSKLQ